jgi:hypothetical protein
MNKSGWFRARTLNSNEIAGFLAKNALKHLKDQITYRAEKTAKGAQVRIATGSPQALIAIHEFLRFQIKDHRTGDSLAVQANPSS